MVREKRDVVVAELRRELESEQSASRFPLDRAVTQVRGQEARGDDGDCPAELARLLDLFEVTSVSAAVAIKRLGSSTSDTSGIRDALVDLWARAEAARSLVFDVLGVWTGEERERRVVDLWETARLLAPDAIAIAMRLSEPVSQYVEFASEVIDGRSANKGSDTSEAPRS